MKIKIHNWEPRPIEMAMIIIIVLAIGAYSLLRWKGIRVAATPAAKNLDVPFTSQAPDASWSEPWKNACEETSIIMVDSFFKDKTLTRDEARQKILAVFAVKEKNIGSSKDESLETIAEIINDAKLGWSATVSPNPELNAIKKEIAAGRPVIVPIDARLLKNSPYTNTDLNYHVIVISGYDDKNEQFIVQDPGTITGKSDRYSYENLYNAINDFLPGANPSGRKAVLFTQVN